MELKEYLDTSPSAKKVKLAGRVVLQRTLLSPLELREVRARNAHAIPRKEALCELEVGGRVIARGELVEKGGENYFKLTEGA